MSKESPVVFFNVGWMHAYCGARGDTIRGGGGWVEKHGVGSEMYNFARYRGRMYGYVATPGRAGTINLERLAANADGEHLDGITVAWVAKRPAGGLRLVGWYENARVFRAYQDAPSGSSRAVRFRRRNDDAPFLVTARVGDAVLLEPDARTLEIPRNRKGAMGQSNIWFAESALGLRTAAKVREFIANGGQTEPTKRRRGSSRAIDPVRRTEVEQAAIRRVREYYEGLGFDVLDVQGDNVGWDLEARCGRKERLLIEVKGLGGEGIVAELTPNEYAQMRRHWRDYRLCVVIDALNAKKRTLRCFQRTSQRGQWVDQFDNALEVQEMTGARVSLGSTRS